MGCLLSWLILLKPILFHQNIHPWLRGEYTQLEEGDEIKVYLEDCLVPAWETINILQSGDLVKVIRSRPASEDNERNQQKPSSCKNKAVAPPNTDCSSESSSASGHTEQVSCDSCNTSCHSCHTEQNTSIWEEEGTPEKPDTVLDTISLRRVKEPVALKRYVSV